MAKVYAGSGAERAMDIKLERALAQKLHDALAQAVAWIEECGSDYEGREFVLMEARAVLGIRKIEDQ